MVRNISITCLFIGTVLLCGVALAHAVGADAYVVDEGKVIQVEAWFSGGQVPKKGTVLILGEDKREVAKGDLEQGVFRFSPETSERFFFVVSLGEGHVKKFPLSDKQLAKLRVGGAPEVAAPQSYLDLAPTEPSGSQREQRASEERNRTLERALLGLLLIGMATAVAVEVKLSKRLRRLEQAVEGEGEGDSGNTLS